MNKAAVWLKTIRLALPIAIGASAAYIILSFFYVEYLSATGVDPLGMESQWDGLTALAYVLVSFIGIPVAIFLFVASIGFMFRSAQWLKSMDENAIEGKPGIIIAAYFVPIANLIFPWRYMKFMNQAGVATVESKSKLKMLINMNLVLAALALIVSGNQWSTIILGAPELTVDEAIVQEWRGIFGSIFDLGAMATLYFIVTPLYEGLAKKQH